MELVPEMDDTIPLELEKALEKAIKKDERTIKREGYGSSDVGLEITKSSLVRVTEYVNYGLSQEWGNEKEQCIFVIGQLAPELIALCGLQTVIHSVVLGDTMQEMYDKVGRAIQFECWAAGLTKDDPKLAKRIEDHVRNRHSSVKSRRQAARSIARRAEYTVKRWPRQAIMRAGSWLTGCVVGALSDVFAWQRDSTAQPFVLSILPGALEAAQKAVGEAIDRRPVYVPRTEMPHPWASWRAKHVDPRLDGNLSFLRTPHHDVIAACKAAIADGTMKPALDAVTAMQSVPWRINKRIYGVMRGCMEQGIKVKGLPGADELEAPEKPRPWDEMTDLEKTLWSILADESERQNRAARNDALSLTEDIETARLLHDEDRFYTMMNCDWRGRVYAMTHFNFQREDRVRALFEFADGEPIGEDGLRWLMIHVANCGEFDGVHKQSLDAREAWTIKNIPRIQAMCEVPLKDLWWTKADKPFLFLAACIEMTSAIAAGPTFTTTIPVSFDGSCSGLQHLASMTRDQTTAKLVNLMRGDRPNDVYAVIAEDVRKRLSKDVDPLAAKYLGLGVDRSLVKRNVMTYSYSSKKYGMASQQQVDYLDDLFKKYLKKEIEDHPFGQSRKVGAKKPTRAARFLASHVFDAIEARINLPAQAMHFLQTLAKVTAHEGKPLTWKSPAGIPWINRYHEPIVRQIRLSMHDRGVPIPMQMRVSGGFKKEIDKDRAANGVAPNFVHALDASHLMLTVNAAVSAGITNIATVHDSFGCLASQATRFNQIIREEFMRMYETHDVLSEVLERAKCDLTQHSWQRLPSVPQYGQLELKEIEHATYAFA